MNFVKIPAGTFIMGSPESEKNRLSDETQHRVTLTTPFDIGETQVTQDQWKAVMGNNPSYFKGANRPVENVSWDDVQAFIVKLNAEPSEFVARLPTEAEWEYCCRAGTETAYSFGEKILETFACYEAQKTVGVKSFKANPWGLYDMHGNVWEWCQDLYGPYPADVMDPTGAVSGSYRVLRGGSWHDSPVYLRSARRYLSSPGLRYSGFGFRLCRERKKCIQKNTPEKSQGAHILLDHVKDAELLRISIDITKITKSRSKLCFFAESATLQDIQSEETGDTAKEDLGKENQIHVSFAENYSSRKIITLNLKHVEETASKRCVQEPQENVGTPNALHSNPFSLGGRAPEAALKVATAKLERIRKILEE